MKKALKARQSDDFRPEYDLSHLGPMVRGKMLPSGQSLAQTLILIEPELARVFPDSESVNRALRLLMETAEASAAPAPARRRAPKKKRLQSSR